MGIAGACRCTEYRYCGIPDQTCRRCEGSGLVVGGDVAGWDSLVVLRAAIMAMDEGKPRVDLLAKGLLADAPTGSFVGKLPYGSSAATYGRQAGQLLVSLGLRKSKARKTMTPAERAERKRAKAAAAESQRVMVEAMGRRQEERQREMRRKKVERKAALAIAAAHPDEFETEKEAQEVFVALEEALPLYNGTSTYMHMSAKHRR